MDGFLRLLGRICFAAIFIWAGATKIPNFDATVAYIAKEGVPYAYFMAIAAIVIELGAGILILIGWRTKLAATLLILFMIPVTYFFHDFWTFEGAEAVGQMQSFMKNLALLGGALYIAATGAGAISIDGKSD